MFTILASFTLALALGYMLLMMYFLNGWSKMEAGPAVEISETDLPKFSIVIPARNEEENIVSCLEDIIQQDYPIDHFEIIVVDDCSTDETAARVNDFFSKHLHSGQGLTYIKMADSEDGEQNSFKKAALSTGIGFTSFKWIITSDADCRRGNAWLKHLASHISIHGPLLLSAPVAFQNPQNFFERVQTLEFAGLVGIGGASIANRSPNMCNGANLAFRKDAFNAVGGYQGIDDIASGDDEFLMHKIHAKWPGSVHFLKAYGAIAYTQPAKSISEFISQRRRWVSKSRKYDNKSITAILSGAYIFHALLLFSLVYGFFDIRYLWVFCSAFLLKVLAEWLFLGQVTAFFKQTKLLQLVIPAAFLYIFYVLFIGIYGNFGRYEWKGRRVK